MYKKLTNEGKKWIRSASKDMKLRVKKYNSKTKKNKKKRTLPKHYTASLSKKDKKKQIRSIRKASKAYRKGKYINRPKLKSYQSKKSSWVTKFEKKYGKDAKTYKEIEKVTGIPKKDGRHLAY